MDHPYLGITRKIHRILRVIPKTAIKIFKSYSQLRTKPYWGNHFWSKGYCVDTIGLDEDKIKKCVKYQEDQERLEEQQRLNFVPL